MAEAIARHVGDGWVVEMREEYLRRRECSSARWEREERRDCSGVVKRERSRECRPAVVEEEDWLWLWLSLWLSDG